MLHNTEGNKNDKTKKKWPMRRYEYGRYMMAMQSTFMFLKKMYRLNWTNKYVMDEILTMVKHESSDRKCSLCGWHNWENTKSREFGKVLNVKDKLRILQASVHRHDLLTVYTHPCSSLETWQNNKTLRTKIMQVPDFPMYNIRCQKME